MDLVRRAAQSLREFLRVRRQPVAHGGLPAVVDLEYIALGENPGAAGEIGEDAFLVDILIAVVPARIPGNALCGLFRQTHGGKPAVVDLLLRALGIEEIKNMELSAAAHAAAVARERELPGVGVIADHGVAARFIERAEQPEMLASPPVGIGFAVRHARRFRVIGEIVIAVALQSQRLEARERTCKGGRAVLHTALRRVGPALKAVDENALARLRIPEHRAGHTFKRIVRQGADDAVLSRLHQRAAGDRRAVFQFHAP